MSESRPCLCGCGTLLPARPNRGEPRKFLDGAHKLAFERAARQVGAAALADKIRPAKAKRRTRGPSARAHAVSQYVFMALVPVEERAELIRQAAENLGITKQDAIEAAMRRAQVPNYEGSV